jgi:hypothetical protein
MSWKLVAATPLDVSRVTAVGAADLGATAGGIGGASVSVSVGSPTAKRELCCVFSSSARVCKGCFRKGAEQVRQRRHRQRNGSLTR